MAWSPRSDLCGACLLSLQLCRDAGLAILYSPVRVVSILSSDELVT